MLELKRLPLAYEDHLGQKVRHYILMAKERDVWVLLSHANLYLRKTTISSIKTSGRYSSVISMFYRYLSSLNKYANISVAHYHALFDNDDIQRWQLARQRARVETGRASPSSETIFDDAKLVLGFCHWLNNNGYVTGVAVKVKTWVANFKSDGMLNYLQRNEQITIDSATIKVLDKERRQRQAKSLITNDEIHQLMNNFADPVYREMFRLSLGTAMRPAELCAFPYLGAGSNAHIMPYSSMTKVGSTVDYTVLGKGNKLRTIKVNIKDLESLEKNYIAPFYRKRAEIYEKRFGKKPPLSVLFLSKKGIPVNAEAVSARTHAAKKSALKRNPAFRESVTFYDARHWWPTQFLINFFGDELLSKTSDVLFTACAEVLRNQLGHESLETTYKHYVDLARVVLMAHKGLVHDIVTKNGESVEDFINRFDLRYSIPVEVDDDNQG